MNQDENDDDGSMSHQQHLNAARTETPAKEDLLQGIPPEALFGNAAGGAEDDEVEANKNVWKCQCCLRPPKNKTSCSTYCFKRNFAWMLMKC